jgi:hypothetical protein
VILRQWEKAAGECKKKMSDDRDDRESLATSGRRTLKRSELSTARRISVRALLNDDGDELESDEGEDEQQQQVAPLPSSGSNVHFLRDERIYGGGGGGGSGRAASSATTEASASTSASSLVQFLRSDSSSVFWGSSVSMSSSPSLLEMHPPAAFLAARPASASSHSLTSSMRSAVSSSAESTASSTRRAHEIDVYVYDSICDPSHVLGQLLLAPSDSVADLRTALATELAEAHPSIASGAYDIVRSDGVIVIADFDQFPLGRCMRAPVEHLALFWR